MVRGSFSFRGKSSLQLLQKKMRKKGFKVKAKKGKESERGEETWESVEEERRRRFWWRWLSFVRGHWPGHGMVRREGRSKSVATALQSLGTASESNATSTDVIEIPIEPGQKISKILIKPTRTGIKAMIGQCRTRQKWSPSVEASWDGDSETKCSEECGEPRERSANWRTEIFKNETEVAGRKETLLTSALFIREDMDNIVESAVFIEPNLGNDYLDSKKSDDLSQKSIKINKRRISYRIIDERNEEIRKTIKTISEPTWMERKNILRRQRLHEDINNLLEQLMFLESEDIVGLTIPQSRAAHDRKAVHFGGDSSHTIEDHPQKQISREVSPEILVNKKPFKEYLSEDYLGTGLPPHGEKQNLERTESPARTATRWKSSREKVERVGEVLVSEERGQVEASKSRCGSGDVMQRTSGTERETKEEVGELGCGRCIERQESAICTIWGVCKTYSACMKATKREAKAGEGRGSGSSRESLDELLETLDDSDHDVVFQKNISQFRKKINVVPRLDMRKSNGRVTDVKKMKRGQNYLELIKPIIECVMEESEEEERAGRGRAFQGPDRRSTGAASVWSAEKWGSEGKSPKVLVTHFLVLTEWNLVRRALGIRTEEATVKIVGGVREMYSLRESSRCTVVQREEAASCEALGEVHLVCGTGNGVPGSGEKVDLRNLEAMIVGIEGEDLGLELSREDISQALPLFPNAAECFYVVEDPRFSSLQRPSGCELEKPGGKLVGELRKDGRGLRAVKLSEPGVRGPNGGWVGRPLQRHSESDFREKAAEVRAVRSECSAAEGSPCAREDGGVGKQASFEILYNNDRESLDDDEEAAKAESGERMEKAVFSSEELEARETEEEEGSGGGGGGGAGCAEEGGRGSRTTEKWSRFLRYKSSSSPRENIIANELGCQEHRTRRSLIFLKEMEKDFQNCKKRRLLGDKGAEMRRTGSALAEVHSPKVGQDGGFPQTKSSFGGGVKTLGSLILPEELVVKPEREQKTLDNMKVVVTDAGGANVRKEVIAAFNSIKELGACKGEAKGGNKRMSLVIMLSKK